MSVASGFAAFVIVAAIGLAAPVDALRVLCQGGQPPYSDENREVGAARACEGLFADMFYTIADRMGLTYTMTVLHTTEIDSRLEVNATTGASEFDMAIAFHTVSPERLRTIDFSVTVYQTDYKIALLPEFKQERTTLVESVIRDSVLYLFSVIALVAALMAIIVFVFESASWEATDLLECPLWQRVFWAMEQGLEATINGGTAGDFRHPVSRFFRTLAGLIGLIYLVGIFGAVITSQLTTSALNAGTPGVTDLRGKRIASASPSLNAFLSSPLIGISVDAVEDVEIFAQSFYNRSRPTLDKGFVAPAATVDYLHRTLNGEGQGFLVTEAFTSTGSLDLKAFPFSRAADRTLFAEFNRQAQHMREDGELAQLVSKWVVSATSEAESDFPTPAGWHLALGIICGFGFGLIFVVSVMLLLFEKVKGTKGGDDDAAQEDPALLYNGRAVSALTPIQAAMLDAATAAMDKAGDGDSTTGQPKRRRVCGMAVEGIPKDEQ